jgi:hypothetical protein
MPGMSQTDLGEISLCFRITINVKDGIERFRLAEVPSFGLDPRTFAVCAGSISKANPTISATIQIMRFAHVQLSGQTLDQMKGAPPSKRGQPSVAAD